MIVSKMARLRTNQEVYETLVKYSQESGWEIRPSIKRKFHGVLVSFIAHFLEPEYREWARKNLPSSANTELATTRQNSAWQWLILIVFLREVWPEFGEEMARPPENA